MAERTGKKLVQDELLLPKMGGVRLRMALDQYLWKERDGGEQKNHVTLGELAEWFPRYLYLPRVKNRDTLVEAIGDGASVLITDDTFATAEAYDNSSGRYLGLRIGGAPSSIDNSTCIVKVDVARKQQEEDGRRIYPPPIDPPPGDPPPGDPPPIDPPIDPPRPQPTDFVGSVRLNGARVGKDAGRIADEVLSHLIALPGAQVSVTMEIEIKVPDGVDDGIVRIIRENANALKFDHAEFEEE